VGTVTRDIDSVEPLGHLSRHGVVSDDDSHVDLATRRGVAQCVVQEVGQNLGHPIGVGVDDGWFLRDLGLDQDTGFQIRGRGRRH